MLKEKDKKLVWSLEDALKKNKEMGVEGDKMDDKIRIKDIDPNKDMLVYEYEVKDKPFDAAQNASNCVIPKWLLGLLGVLCAALLLAIIIILALKAATPTSYEGYNSACDNGTKICDASKGLTCTNSICVCASATPTLVDNSYCVLGNSYLDSCTSNTDCDTTKNLQCVSGFCKCKTVGSFFWSDNYQTCRAYSSPFSISTGSSGTSFCYSIQTGSNTCSGNSSKLIITSQEEFENLKIVLSSNTNNAFCIGAIYSSSGWSWSDTTYGNGDSTTFTDQYRWCQNVTSLPTPLSSVQNSCPLTITLNSGASDACVDVVTTSSTAPSRTICEMH